MEHLIRPNNESDVVIDVTPASAGWRYLNFKVVSLAAGQRYSQQSGADEVALVPLVGQGNVEASGERFGLYRKGFFDELPHVLYMPPGEELVVEAATAFEFAIGGAPAEGKYPTRLFTPDEMKQEVRDRSITYWPIRSRPSGLSSLRFMCPAACIPAGRRTATTAMQARLIWRKSTITGPNRRKASPSTATTGATMTLTSSLPCETGIWCW
jgi:hypothetical protein